LGGFWFSWDLFILELAIVALFYFWESPQSSLNGLGNQMRREALRFLEAEERQNYHDDYGGHVTVGRTRLAPTECEGDGTGK